MYNPAFAGGAGLYVEVRTEGLNIGGLEDGVSYLYSSSSSSSNPGKRSDGDWSTGVLEYWSIGVLEYCVICESHPHDGGGVGMLAMPDARLAFAMLPLLEFLFRPP